MKTLIKKPILIITIIAAIIYLLVFISPLLILYYAEEQYFVDKYNENKNAFATVKNELLYILEHENVAELKLSVSYDSDNNLFLHHYHDREYILSADTNSEAYNLINESFGDFMWSKVYVSENYIIFSEEGNNYQFIYCKDKSPETMIYGNNDNKIRKLGDDWYLIVPN